MNKIYFDFDGTLIDHKLRNYEVYKKILSEESMNYLSFEQYLSFRKKGYNHLNILQQTNCDDILEIFYKKRNKYLENYNYLVKYDAPNIKNIKTFLGNLFNDYNLYLVSLRDSKYNLIRELKYFGIYYFFKNILTDSQYGNSENKIKLMEKTFPNKSDYIVGDSDIDLIVGDYFNINTVFYPGGFFTKKRIKELGLYPKYIIHNLGELKEVL